MNKTAKIERDIRQNFNAGRLLDEEIHERVFGLHWTDEIPIYYSSIPTTALLVVEKLQEYGHWVVINTSVDVRRYTVEVRVNRLSTLSTGQVYGEFSYAICVAALLAMEIEKEMGFNRL